MRRCGREPSRKVLLVATVRLIGSDLNIVFSEVAGSIQGRDKRCRQLLSRDWTSPLASTLNFPWFLMLQSRPASLPSNKSRTGSLTFVLEFLRLRQYAQLLLKDHQNSGNSGPAGCNGQGYKMRRIFRPFCGMSDQ